NNKKGHNLDKEIQRNGTLDAFVDFVVSLALEGTNWYSRLNDSDATSKFGLNAISTMG
ncbi:MAG: hypothetical protein GY880_33045, partial [Planctomycetaceae bacterium]|nr:hypothetical protein [Planctomycetaceae bacterium]